VAVSSDSNNRVPALVKDTVKPSHIWKQLKRCSQLPRRLLEFCCSSALAVVLGKMSMPSTGSDQSRPKCYCNSNLHGCIISFTISPVVNDLPTLKWHSVKFISFFITQFFSVFRIEDLVPDP
jgi:hypothetical protein